MKYLKVMFKIKSEKIDFKYKIENSQYCGFKRKFWKRSIARNPITVDLLRRIYYIEKPNITQSNIAKK